MAGTDDWQNDALKGRSWADPDSDGELPQPVVPPKETKPTAPKRDDGFTVVARKTRAGEVSGGQRGAPHRGRGHAGDRSGGDRRGGFAAAGARFGGDRYEAGRDGNKFEGGRYDRYEGDRRDVARSRNYDRTPGIGRPGGSYTPHDTAPLDANRDAVRNTAGFDDRQPPGPNKPREEVAKNWREPTYELCLYNVYCANDRCQKIHHKDRDISKIVVDPARLVCVFALNGAPCPIKVCNLSHDASCEFGAKCSYRCILRHPEGHSPEKVECEEGLECSFARCVGVHPEGWTQPVCQFDPFCTRIDSGLCQHRHTDLNGTLRMIKGFCNYKTNGMECIHEDPCSYEDPSKYKCKHGAGCRYLKLTRCGFMH